MTKCVRKSKSTASDSDIESSLKKQRFNFIAYKNASSEEEFSLKCFENTFRFSLSSTTLSNVEMTSQSQQFSEMNWMRQQMTQMQIMMEQMFRSQCLIDFIELE